MNNQNNNTYATYSSQNETSKSFLDTLLTTRCLILNSRGRAIIDLSLLVSLVLGLIFPFTIAIILIIVWSTKMDLKIVNDTSR